MFLSPMSFEFESCILFDTSCSWGNPLAGWLLEIAVPLGVFSMVGSEQVKRTRFSFPFSTGIATILEQFLYLNISSFTI